MKLQTIGFTKKTAQTFFEILHDNSTNIVVDTRINNKSQLAGFSKEQDLKYFLQKIFDIKYDYRPDLAPTKELLKKWRNGKISWQEYEQQYIQLIVSRRSYLHFFDDYKKNKNVCILCSESTTTYCHRRLLSNLLLQTFPEIKEINDL